MDLVRIFHMVDTPSSGKHDFNYIYVVGLILSILIHFESVLFDSVHIGFLSLRCSSNIHVLVWFWLIVPRMLACVILFLLCFLSIFTGTRCCSVDLCGFPSYFICCSQMTMVWIDHPVVVHTENVTQKFTYTNVFIYIYILFQPFNIHL